MASIKDIAKGRSDVYRVSPFDLKVKPNWNGREPDHPDNIAHIDQLAQSIAEVGVKETLTAYMEGDDLFVENGHMRLAASLRAIEMYGADKDMLIPVQTSPRDATEADRILSQIIRNSGKQLSPLEMAAVFERLNALDLSDADIARRTGLSRVYIGQLIALHHMPKSTTSLVRDGKVSATLAIQTMKRFEGDAKKTAAVLKEAVAFAKGKGKARATAKHVKDVSPEGEEAAPKVTKAATKALPEGRTAPKSMMTVMAETRTILENATIAEDDAEVIICMDSTKYAELAELLDLTVRFAALEAEAAESEATPEAAPVKTGKVSKVEQSDDELV